MNTVIQFTKKIDSTIFLSFLISFLLISVAFILGYSFETEYSPIEERYGIVDIFINNATISLILFAGIVSFGIINFIIAVINGFYFGSILKYGFLELEISEIAEKLLPHSIFEIPAILISVSVGFLPILLLIRRGHSNVRLKYRFYLKYVGLMFILVIILNLIAAFLEATLSM